MTEKSILKTLGIIKELYLINHPQAEFQSDEKILKVLHERSLVPALKYLKESLKIAPGRNIEDCLVLVLTNRIFAANLSKFFVDSDLVLNSGEAVREKLFIPFPGRVRGQAEDSLVFIPAIIVEGTEYPLVREDEIPDAWTFLRGGFAVPLFFLHWIYCTGAKGPRC